MMDRTYIPCQVEMAYSMVADKQVSDQQMHRAIGIINRYLRASFWSTDRTMRIHVVHTSETLTMSDVITKWMDATTRFVRRVLGIEHLVATNDCHTVRISSNGRTLGLMCLQTERLPRHFVISSDGLPCVTMVYLVYLLEQKFGCQVIPEGLPHGIYSHWDCMRNGQMVFDLCRARKIRTDSVYLQ